MMHPAVYEIAILTLMGVSGVGLAWLMGFRHVLPLTVAGLAASISLRILSSVALWTFGLSSGHLEAWAAVSFLLGGTGLVLSRAAW